MSEPRGQRALVAVAGPDGGAAGALLQASGAVVERIDPASALPPGDLLVVDEWTAETAPHVVDARRRGTRVTVLAELVLERITAPVLAVTGTAGKTTTARLAAHILERSGIPVVCADARAANAWPDHTVAGVSVPDGGWFVAELTSTHLCYMERWGGPDIAVVTNLWPDHVELHGSLERYVAAKRRILANPRATAVLNADDVAGRALLGTPLARRILEFSERLAVAHGVWRADGRVWFRDGGPTHVVTDRPRWLEWAHPSAVVAACAAAIACGVEPARIAAALEEPIVLPHRMRPIGRIGAVRIVDDSMAATPRKALAALTRMAPGPAALIAGGLSEVHGRGVHATEAERKALDDVCAAAAARFDAIVRFGPAGKELDGRFGGIVSPWVDDAAAAVRVAAELLPPGGTVLVAPAFPMAQDDRRRIAEIVEG